MNTTKPTETPRFVLSEPDFQHPPTGCSIHRAFGGQHSFFLGGRYKKYHFPRTLVNRCKKIIGSSQFTLEQPTDLNQAALHALRPIPGLSLQIPERFSLSLPIPERFNFIALPASVNEPSAFRRSAQAMANQMTEDMFVSAMHDWFDQDLLVVTRDKPLLPPETAEICDSLRDHIIILQTKVPAWLKQVMAAIYVKFPDATTGQVYQAAVQLITDQLKPILSTVQMWTTGFRQWLNPALQPRLKIIRAMMEQKLFLVLTGELKLDLIEDCAQIKQKFPTIKVSVGDVIIPVLIGPFDSGPAVIPMTGAVGPRGGHLVFYQSNFLNTIGTSDKPYDHETGHVVMGIVPGFAEEYAQMTRDAIDQAAKSGKLKLSGKFVMIGKQKVPAIEFLKNVFLNQLGELIADLFGCLIGGAPAFTKAYATFIGSMVSMALGGMDKVSHVIGNASSFKLVRNKDGSITVVLEPHPQDLVRTGSWQSDIAMNTDFPETAKWLQDLTARESGKPMPNVVIWRGKCEDQAQDEPEDKQIKKLARKPKKRAAKADPEICSIEQLVADYAAGSEVVAEYLLNTKAECLNGETLKTLVCLTPKMFERKVLPLKDLLKRGIGKIPDGKHYFFHQVGSAATIAYLELVEERIDPLDGKTVITPEEALARVNKASEEMMTELLGPWEEIKHKHGIYDLPAAQLQPKCTYKKSTCDGSCEAKGKCPGDKKKAKPAKNVNTAGRTPSRTKGNKAA